MQDPRIAKVLRAMNAAEQKISLARSELEEVLFQDYDMPTPGGFKYYYGSNDEKDKSPL